MLHEGRPVETGNASTVIRRAEHPYTRRLLDAIPNPYAAAADG